MKTTRFALSILAAALLTSSMAQAEDWRAERQHYIVTLDEKMTEGDRALRSELQILKVDCFAHGGQYHYVISAKSDGHVGAFLYNKGIQNAEVRSLPVKWTNEGFAALPKEQRLGFAEAAEVF